MSGSPTVLVRIRDNVKSFSEHKDVFETVRIVARSGGRGMVVCTCGGGVQFRPNDLMYDQSWGGCSHIVALFTGRVTEDRELSKRSYHAAAYGGAPGVPHALPYVEVTQEGHEFFGWRWAAQAMNHT